MTRRLSDYYLVKRLDTISSQLRTARDPVLDGVSNQVTDAANKVEELVEAIDNYRAAVIVQSQNAMVRADNQLQAALVAVKAGP